MLKFLTVVRRLVNSSTTIEFLEDNQITENNDNYEKRKTTETNENSFSK
jgi:hypothetical protein